jgi:ubiquinone/menaquinone biosynthesis C-methylase UbiE
MFNKSYREFSQIYDLLMVDIDYENWTSFIINKIGGSRKILEAACGTGNITQILADKNYKVTAFDISQDMLVRAYSKLGRSPGVKLLNLDMTNFKIDDKFDAAICCCDGINYIDENEAKRFFKNIYNHLASNSKFIFDISTKYKYVTMFNDTYVYDDGEIFYVWENEAYGQNKSVNMEINFFVRNDGNKYIRINEIQTQYIHNTKVLTRLLKEAGFSKIEIYDDYCEKPLSETSLRAVFCSAKISEDDC